MDEKGLAGSKLFENALGAFTNGGVCDFRMKLAIELVTHGTLYHGFGFTPAAELAKHALDVASALVEEGLARGLIEPLDSEAGKDRMKEHMRRHVDFNLDLANEQRRAQDQSLAVGRHVHGALSSN